MTFSRFNSLSITDQLEKVVLEGVPLGTCKRYNLILRLFLLDDFYVEVINLEMRGELVTIRAFQDTDNLEPYLDEIDLSALAV